jgi:hypothetical protein
MAHTVAVSSAVSAVSSAVNSFFAPAALVEARSGAISAAQVWAVLNAPPTVQT